MAKVPEKYLTADPWKIIEDGLHLSKNRVSESIFALGNEYTGVRAFPDEGIDGGACNNALTLQGCYFNGIYEYAKERVSMHYKGIIERTHFMINSVNWLKLRLRAGGETLDIARCKVTDFRRELDLRSGLYTRAFVWHTPKGRLKLTFERLLNMSVCERAYSVLSFESLDFDGEVEADLSLDFNVLHWGCDCYWNKGVFTSEGGAVAVECATPVTNQRIAAAMIAEADISGAIKSEISDGSYSCGFNYSFNLKTGNTGRINRYVTLLAQKNNDGKNLSGESVGRVRQQAKEGFGSALDANKRYYADFWDKSDVSIEGNVEDQQGIRFCLFQLQQTYHGLDGHNNIGAKGLTGEAYSGHAFWDTETYCLPFYLFSNITAAKNLLCYRYHTLDAARERAKQLDCNGACYPIATLNGREACSLWQHASLQFQPSSAVAYGIRHYVNLSGDRDFILDYGMEMLIEISRFFVSRGQWNADKTKFGYYGVMGPDEFQMMVNHNYYTNFMAKMTFLYTLEEARKLKAEKPAGFAALLKKLNVTQREFDEFQRLAECMYLPQDSTSGVFEQHEGFFDLPHIDIHSIPVTDFPLYNNWSYDRIYRNDMIKQPDVLMFMFLYMSGFTLEQKRVNYDYYEPRCIHESSLSPSVHSVFAAELGKIEEAESFFGFAARMDLDDYNRNTGEGLHTTSIAAAWVNIVYGFGGLRSDGEILALNPILPTRWKSYSFRFTHRNTTVKVTVEKNQTRVEKTGGSDITMLIRGKETKLGNEPLVI